MTTYPTAEEPMPSFWACYLINNDASGMTSAEIMACEEHLSKCCIRDVLSVADDERFTWHYRMYGGSAEGGDVATYTVTYFPDALVSEVG